MYCNNCGKPIPDNSNYCNFCGVKLQLLAENLFNETGAAALEDTKQEKTEIISEGIKETKDFSNSMIPWIAFATYAILLTIFATGSSGYRDGVFWAKIGLRSKVYERSIGSVIGYYYYPTNYIGYFVYIGLGFIISLMVYTSMKNRKNVK